MQLHSLIKESAQLRQTVKRMKELIPSKLSAVAGKYRSEHSASKSLRLALIDTDYLAYLDQICALSARLEELNQQVHHFKMKQRARASLNAYARVYQQKNWGRIEKDR